MKHCIFTSLVFANLFFCSPTLNAMEPDCAFVVDEHGNAHFSGDVRIKGELVRSVPIGTVIDWYRPNTSFPVPSGFAICNGATVNDPESSYHGLAVPNLLNRYIRGVTNINSIGSTGGTNNSITKTFNTSNAGSHTHSLSGTTGSVSSTNSPSGTAANYYVRDDNAGWTLNAHLAVDTGGDSSREGQHKHDLQGTTQSSGDHRHYVDFELKGDEKQPLYYGLLKLIRIK